MVRYPLSRRSSRRSSGRAGRSATTTRRRSGSKARYSRERATRKGAERSYAASLDWARHQQAKSFELRTATSHARLLRDQGRVGEAHDLLAPVYGWFTEGFGTKDLREAKALLNELEARNRRSERSHVEG